MRLFDYPMAAGLLLQGMAARLFDYSMPVGLFLQGITGPPWLGTDASKVKKRISISDSAGSFIDDPYPRGPAYITSNLQCRRNTRIFWNERQWKRGHSNQFTYWIPPEDHSNEDECAAMCSKHADFFAYSFGGGRWYCMCVTSIPSSAFYLYWEGGVIGNINCTAAPPLPVPAPDLPAVPPRKFRRNPNYFNCWNSSRWPDCWPEIRSWLGNWSHLPADNNPNKSLCFNSYAISWEGFRFNKHGVSANGEEFGMEVTLDWCMHICKHLDDCIAIKWSRDNYCWLHSAAFYVEVAEASCDGLAVFQARWKQQEVIPAYMDRTCPCAASVCRVVNQCFRSKLNNSDDAEKQACLDVQEFRGNLSSLRNAKMQCDSAVRNCQQQYPQCFLNITLAWEQALLHLHGGASISLVALSGQKRLNDGVTQALLQRSGRGLEEGAEPFLSDVDGNGKISLGEFQISLESKGYQLSGNAVANLFNSLDTNHDGVLQAGEAAVAEAKLPAFCPCEHETPSGVSLIQGSSMENLGKKEDLDSVYGRKRCR